MYNNGRKDILEPDDLAALHELTLERGDDGNQYVHMTFRIRADREPFAEGEQPNFLFMTNGVASQFFSVTPRPAAIDVAPAFVAPAAPAEEPAPAAPAEEPAPAAPAEEPAPAAPAEEPAPAAPAEEPAPAAPAEEPAPAAPAEEPAPAAPAEEPAPAAPAEEPAPADESAPTKK